MPWARRLDPWDATRDMDWNTCCLALLVCCLLLFDFTQCKNVRMLHYCSICPTTSLYSAEASLNLNVATTPSLKARVSLTHIVQCIEVTYALDCVWTDHTHWLLCHKVHYYYRPKHPPSMAMPEPTCHAQGPHSTSLSPLKPGPGYH